ncbi:MAG: sigma-70 family RNA polymerase sigma factor [Planctomycetota bacterium]|nr:MAG: sigma-70 family RNA polymerase sigma factor [Planctomycetota bacterium]
MLRVRDGDERAFEELVQAYQDRLVGLFYHMFGRQDVAEDLTQDVFLRVYAARGRYRPTARFSTWLFRIAHNVAMNYRRSKRHAKEVPLKTTESGPLGMQPLERLIAEKSALMPSRQLAAVEQQKIVRDAIEKLSERQRMVVLLNRFEHMSYADIAAVMNLSTDAVKSLLSRARRNLREYLEPVLKREQR